MSKVLYIHPPPDLFSARANRSPSLAARSVHLQKLRLGRSRAPRSVRSTRPLNADPDALTYDVYLRRSAELEIDADFQVVNLAEGANFDPEFLKIVGVDLSPFLRISFSPLAEPKRHSPHPHPRGEIVHEYRGRDQLSRVHLIDSSPSGDLHRDGGARREGRSQLCVRCLSKDPRI